MRAVFKKTGHGSTKDPVPDYKERIPPTNSGEVVG